LLGLAWPRSGPEIQSPKSMCTYKSLWIYITGKEATTTIHSSITRFRNMSSFPHE
jgi:hypothetical protein